MAQCYVAKDLDGDAYAAAVINPRWAKSTAKDVARWIREGASIEIVDSEQIAVVLDVKKLRAKGGARLSTRKKRKTAASVVDEKSQMSLMP